ncbi:LysM peptidoglycan-binding domain-containing protein [Mycolicibacter kumamotonensis]|nr:LysM peptidoglycan-binding domain-containing protein [Mycolicibacter kumamotonensis]
MFNTEQTQQPGEYPLDADERLNNDANSLSFDSHPESDEPGPNPDLFAKSAEHSPYLSPEDYRTLLREEHDAHEAPERDYDDDIELHHLSSYRRADNQPISMPTPAVPDTASASIGGPSATIPGAGDTAVTDNFDTSPGTSTAAGASLQSIASLDMDPRYATWMLEARADHFNDPVQRFRDDPIREIQRQASIHAGGHDPDMEQYGLLIEGNKQLREAAWDDVQAKAKRLRREGRVHVKEASPDSIFTSVDGDHGTYDCLIKKGSSFGNYKGGQSIASWFCDCPWGKWAYNRQTKVGRLCSHGLASYWELQARHHRGRPVHQRAASIHTADVVDDYKKWAKDNKAVTDIGSITEFVDQNPGLDDADVAKLYTFLADNPERKEIRDYSDPMGQNWPDALFSDGGSITPDLIMPSDDDDDKQTFVDVCEDDRKTTGPGQIMAMQHHAAPGWYSHTPEENQADRAARDRANGTIGPEMSQQDADRATGGWMEQGLRGLSDQMSVPQGGDSGAGGPKGSGSIVPRFTPELSDVTQAIDGMETPAAKPGIGGADGGAGAFNPAKSGTPAGGAAASTVGQTSPDVNAGGASGVGAGLGAPTGGGAGGDKYKIQPGDTLSGIAQSHGFGDNYQALADANKDIISDPNKIFAGDTIQIPGQSSGSGSSAETPHLTGGGSPGPGNSAGGTGLTAPDLPPAPSALNPGKTSGRYFFAEDFEDDGPAPSGGMPDSQTVANDPSSPGSPANQGTGRPSFGGGPSIPGFGGGTSFNPGAGIGLHIPAIPELIQQAIPGWGGIGAGVLGGSGGEVPRPPGLTSTPHTGSIHTADLLEELRDLSCDDPPLGHMKEHNDKVRDVVEELRDRGVDADQIVAHITGAARNSPETNWYQNYLDEPYHGSGPAPKPQWSTSEAYVDKHERPNFVDVTDLGDDDGITKYGEPPQQRKKAGYRPPEDFGYTGKSPAAQSTDDHSDVVRAFHASLQAQGGGFMADSGNNSGGSYSNDDIASRAASMLRTAGRHFSPAEQRELEDETHHMGARNMPTAADLAGTHYVD